MTIAVPSMMRALVVSNLGEQFAGCAVETVPTPKPGRGEVLVRVRAAGVGFPDLLMTRGAYQHKPDPPFIPGGDMAGEIVALGEGVHDWRAGDAVVGGKLGGAFAEYAAYAASHLRAIPSGVSIARAAAFGSAYLTAYVALVRRAEVKEGEWVLVHGAAGGVGLAAVDLAKALGARVIAASASRDKLAVIDREYAPDAIVDTSVSFRERVKEITGGGADVIYDPVGGDVFDESVRCIAFGGRLLVVGFASGRIPTISVNMPLIKGFSVIGVRAGEYGRRDPEKGRENLQAIWDMLAAGALKPRVHAIHPLSAWREAFRQMVDREVIGRVLIDPSAPNP